MSQNKPSVAARYRYSIVWSPEDEEFVARVLEFPSLSWLAESQEAALGGLRDLIENVVRELNENGEVVPQPFAERNYSGNIKVRVSPQKHRELSIKAAEQGVSLNRYLNEHLTAC